MVSYVYNLTNSETNEIEYSVESLSLFDDKEVVIGLLLMKSNNFNNDHDFLMEVENTNKHYIAVEVINR